ncbi:hypothetical protein LDO31_04520 [Luteimonas sp. XNQY3]|nr:hypothetical protein [Luteimonas sp. XNQY3]MCD9005512.1 hypothetical protein [Luteimonas sp. XNQY3]
MDARRFPTEPGWRVGKCGNERLAGFASSGLALFFGSVSLTRIFDARHFGAGYAVRTACVGPAKEMNPLAARRVEAFDLARPPGQKSEQQHQMLSSAGAAEFISFGRPQKKRNQRKTSPRHVHSPRRQAQRDFPTRHPASVGKRRPSMGGALRVCIACDTFGFMEKLQGDSKSNRNRDILISYANLSPDIA